MRQPVIARVLSNVTRPNLPAGQLVAFGTLSRVTTMRYCELFGLIATAAGIVDSFDSGTPAQATVPFQGCSRSSCRKTARSPFLTPAYSRAETVAFAES